MTAFVISVLSFQSVLFAIALAFAIPYATIVFSSLLKSCVGIPVRLGQHPASAQGIRNFVVFSLSVTVYYHTFRRIASG